MKKIISSFLIISFLLSSSCTTSNYAVYNVAKTDGPFIQYELPSYVNEENTWSTILRWTITLGLAGTFGAAGDIAKKEAKKKGEDTDKQPGFAGGFVIGGLIGYWGGSYVAGALKSSPEPEPNNEVGVKEWLSELDDDLIYVSHTANSVKALPRTSEFSFHPRNIEDVKIFYRVFPNSDQKNNVFEYAYKNLGRGELPLLMALDPNSKFLNNAKSRYVSESEGVYQIISAIVKFPEYKESMEEKALNAVSSIEDAKIFFDHYSFDKHSDVIINRLISKTNREHYPEIIEAFPNSDLTAALKDKYIETAGDFNETVKILEMYPESEKYISLRAGQFIKGDLTKYDEYLKYFPKGMFAQEFSNNLLEEKRKKEERERKISDAFDLRLDKLGQNSKWKYNKYRLVDPEILIGMQNEIYSKLGPVSSMDVNALYDQYLEFTDPDRLMSTYDISSKIGQIGNNYLSKPLRVWIDATVEKLKPRCTKEEYCEESCVNFCFGLLAFSMMASSEYKYKSEQAKYIALGSFLSSVYVSNERNKSFFLYGGLSKMLTEGTRILKTNYFNKPERDWWDDLTDNEKWMITIGFLTWAGTEFVKSDFFQDAMRTAAANSGAYSSVDSYSDGDQSDNVTSRRTSVTIKDIDFCCDDQEVLVGKTHIYWVYLSNGKKVSIKQMENSGSWYFKNGWGETNRGTKAYKTKQDILNALLSKEN